LILGSITTASIFILFSKCKILPKIENIYKKITKKFAGTKPLPEPQTKTNPDCLHLTVFLKPFFAKRSKTKNDSCQADKRKACHNVYSFHYLTFFFLLVIKNKPKNKDNPDIAIPHPYMSTLLSPKSLKNDDTTTPVRMYLDTSIK